MLKAMECWSNGIFDFSLPWCKFMDYIESLFPGYNYTYETYSVDGLGQGFVILD